MRLEVNWTFGEPRSIMMTWIPALTQHSPGTPMSPDQLSPNQLGEAVALVAWSRPGALKTPMRCLKEAGVDDANIALRELLFFRVFAVSYILELLLEQDPRFPDVATAYGLKVAELVLQIDLTNEFNLRMKEYSDAVENGDVGAIGRLAGRVLAQHCSGESGNVWIVGMNHFKQLADVLGEFISQHVCENH